MRLATLLDIGRSLSGATDPAELRRCVASRLSSLFGSDLLFCAETDAAGVCRAVLLVEEGSARRAEATYGAATDAATPDTGRMLDAADAAALGLSGARAAAPSAALVVPIREDGRIRGELGAVRFDGPEFTEADGELLAFGAAILAAAAGQQRRVEETETRRREAERLEEIGRAITSSLDLGEVLARIMEAVLDLTAADVCTVWQRHGDSSRVIASRGTRALPLGLELQVAPEIASALMNRRESIQIADISSDPRLPAAVRAQIAGDGPRSAVLVPMLCADEVVGVLSVGHQDMQRYDGEAMRILQRLALQAAIALENARLHAEIRELSLTDPLTGLPNRRQMEMVLEKEFEAARRGRPLAVVLFDLDEFKAYNDEHGHPEGDEALRAFARILVGETRAMNLAARYGGDEFLTILSESTADGARHLVQRVEQLVRETPRLCGIGVSAGVAQHDRSMRTPRDLIEAADVDLYRSKDDGTGPRARGRAAEDGEDDPVPRASTPAS